MSGIELLRSSSSLESEKPRENCAVVGVYSRSLPVIQIAFDGLVELNHRGQESSGITVTNGKEFQTVKDSGLAGIVFKVKHSLPDLPEARIAIGHNRYSTSGSLAETQPFLENGIAIVHNGNLTNVRHLREKHEVPPEIDGARSDTRIALAVINRMDGDEKQRILTALKEFEGAYSFVFATKNALFASRDPLGFRPLSLGRLKDGGFVVASETAAFSSMGADFIRDVLPGETLMIGDNEITTIALDRRSKFAHCSFEPVYVARPDSVVFGIPVMTFRLREGKILARYLPDVDLIMPVPRSGIGVAQGVAASEKARKKGIPYVDGLYTNPYRGVVEGSRTFILPNGREKAATEKYAANPSIVGGKRIVIVDDSIVRGSLRLVVAKLREAGAREVHALIAFPPITHSCYMGVDMGNGDLLAEQFPDLDQRRRFLGLDSLRHISYAELVEALVDNPVSLEDDPRLLEDNNFCGGCITGRYPVNVEGTIAKLEAIKR